MKIYTLLLLFIFISTIPAFAQKLKDKRVDIKYVALPSKKLPPDFSTYSVHISGANASYAGAEAHAKGVRMDGFKRVEGTQDQYGHLRIMVNTGSSQCGRMELKSKTTTSKNKEGVETKTTTYWYEMPCTASSSHRILDPEGTVLSSGSKYHSDSPKTNESSTTSALSKLYDSHHNSLRSSFARNVAGTAVSMAQNDLSRSFDFAYTSDDPQIYFIKKHPAEDQFESSLEKTKEVFKALSAAAPASEGLKQMGPTLDFWKKYGEQHPGDDKDLMEVFVCCNANLATIYFYLDQFDEANKYIKRILQLDDKDKRSAKFLEMMSAKKALMDFHGIHTMHHSPDRTNAIPPTKVKEIAEEKEQLQEENNSLAGIIFLKGDTINGFFVRAKEDTEFLFGPNGNTKFISESTAAIKEYDLASNDVGGFMIGSRRFNKLSYSPCAKGKAEIGNHILEELYHSDKISLYKYYPVSGALGNEQFEFAFRKAGEPQPVSLMDTRFLLWDKGLGSYFSDCEDLKTMSLSGGFKMAEDDLLKAARIYTEVCN